MDSESISRAPSSTTTTSTTNPFDWRIWLPWAIREPTKVRRAPRRKSPPPKKKEKKGLVKQFLSVMHTKIIRRQEGFTMI
jgi:hypothetical protein